MSVKDSRFLNHKFLHGFLFFLFVVVANDLVAISLGFELKLGFVILIVFTPILWLTVFSSLSPRYFFEKIDMPILIWALLAILFCVMNGGARNYVYTIAMLVYLGMVIGAKAPWLERSKFQYFDLYILSGLVISAIGIGQFLIALLGYGNVFFVQQWWYEGTIARVNGFMYEPSYYALVLFPYVLISFFLFNAEWVDSKRNQSIQWLFYCSAVAIVLSSSRLALVALVLSIPCITIYRAIVLPSTRKYWKGDICRIAGLVGAIILFFTIVNFSVDYLAQPKNTQSTPSAETHVRQSVMNGTGIGGTADHSVSMRYENLQDTWVLAKQHLWMGLGLGNIAKGIAQNQGINEPSSDEISTNEGLVPVLEITAATGLFGIALFLGWLLWITVPRLLKKPLNESDLLHTSMCIAVLGQFSLMQGNQNVLRMYFWVTLFVLMIFNYSALKKSRTNDE